MSHKNKVLYHNQVKRSRSHRSQSLKKSRSFEYSEVEISDQGHVTVLHFSGALDPKNSSDSNSGQKKLYFLTSDFSETLHKVRGQ